jgi:hypothetical protein
MVDGKFLDLDDPQRLKEKHGTVYMLQVEPSVSNSTSIASLNQNI